MKHASFALLAPFAFIAVSACMETPPTDPSLPNPGMSGECPADQYQGLITQSEMALATMSFPGPVRVIHPNDAVTLDYSPSRMNILIDDAGRISRVSCG